MGASVRRNRDQRRKGKPSSHGVPRRVCLHQSTHRYDGALVVCLLTHACVTECVHSLCVYVRVCGYNCLFVYLTAVCVCGRVSCFSHILLPGRHRSGFKRKRLPQSAEPCLRRERHGQPRGGEFRRVGQGRNGEDARPRRRARQTRAQYRQTGDAQSDRSLVRQRKPSRWGGRSRRPIFCFFWFFFGFFPLPAPFSPSLYTSRTERDGADDPLTRAQSHLSHLTHVCEWLPGARIPGNIGVLVLSFAVAQ